MKAKSKKKIVMNTANLYEMNKQAIAHEANVPYNRDDITTIAEQIADGPLVVSSDYLMLLCNDRHDYTIFNKEGSFDRQEFIEAFADCLMARGSTLSIDKTEDEDWEIWIRNDEHDGEINVYYLFDYDYGMVDVRERNEKDNSSN